MARQYGNFAWVNGTEKSPLSEFTNDIRRSKESDTHNADIFMKANAVWGDLKTFSMLTVRKRNTSSIHRLLQSLLRSSQSKQEQESSIVCCYRAIASLWGFNPAKSSTWKSAGTLLPHAKSICGYICTDAVEINFPVQITVNAARMLCECGLYMSMVLSHFTAAKLLLDKACFTLEAVTIDIFENKMLIKNALTHAYLTRGKIARYCGEYRNSDEDMNLALSHATEDWDIAAIYHEMGVLALKTDNFKNAKDSLLKSLKIKRRLNANLKSRGSDAKLSEQKPQGMSSSVVLTFSGDEAATLHQLAVVNLRENNLLEAERLFRCALSAESEAGQGGRAATLGQLGRVLDRQGKLKESLQCLQDAKKAL